MLYSERVRRSCRFPHKNTIFSFLSLRGDETLVLLWKGLRFKFSLYYILSANALRSSSVRWRWELPASLCNWYFTWYWKIKSACLQRPLHSISEYIAEPFDLLGYSQPGGVLGYSSITINERPASIV